MLPSRSTVSKQGIICNVHNQLTNITRDVLLKEKISNPTLEPDIGTMGQLVVIEVVSMFSKKIDTILHGHGSLLQPVGPGICWIA